MRAFCEPTSSPMIRPEEYEAAVSGLRFLCGATASSRQYTFVEITVEERTDRDVAVSFCVPGESTPRDEKALQEAIGGPDGGVINEAMDAWGEWRTDSLLRVASASVSFGPAPSTVSSEVSGCSVIATVVVPAGGGCTVNACWSHEICKKRRSSSIVVPTFNENFSGWRVDAIVMQGDGHNHGRPPKHSFSRSFRHDLATPALAAAGEQPFLPTDGALLFTRRGPSLPYHNLHVQFQTAGVDDCSGSAYSSLCGAVVVDNTARRMVSFYDVMFVAVPSICGAYVRNSISYPRCFVPLTISERLCRRCPVEFCDASDGSPRVDVRIDGRAMYRIDPRKRVAHETLHWVELESINADEKDVEMDDHK